MLSVSGLATNATLTAVKNKITDISILVKKKTDYNAKILRIEYKCITKADYHKYTKDIVAIKRKK